MNDDARPQQQRRRSRRRADNSPRRPEPARGFTPRRRNDYASGQYSSIYTGPFPTDADDEGLNLADLQAKSIDELRELAAEHEIAGLRGARALRPRPQAARRRPAGPVTAARPQRPARHGRGRPRDRRRGLRLPARERRHAVGAGHLRQLSRRCAASACAPATASPARPASRRTRRSTSACCASRPSTASTRRSPSAARTSTR